MRLKEREVYRKQGILATNGKYKSPKRRASRQFLPAATALSAGGVELIILVGIFIIIFLLIFIMSCPLFLFLGGAAFVGFALFLFLLMGLPALRGCY
jgi:hypothetical protein